MRKILIFLALFLGAVAGAQAQTAVSVMPVPRIQFLAANGSPLASGCLFTYSGGTSTPLATYTDSSGTILNSNPVILDSGGFASIWVSGVTYKFVLFSAGGVNCASGTQQWTVDNVSSNLGLISLPNTWSGNQSFTGNNTHSGTETFTSTVGMSAGGALGGTWTGNPIFSGNILSTGKMSLTNLNGSIIFADQLSPSSSLCSVSTGTDASAKIQCAINLLPVTGGTVDARALTDAGGTGSTTIDPGTKAITVLLGPTTYNLSQVILKRAFHMAGMGAYPANGTIIQATGGNGTPPFILDQGGVQASQDVILQGFELQGTAANTTQDAFHLIAPAGMGLWYSEFDDIVVNGFGGVGLNLDGQANGPPAAANQFDTFNRIVVYRLHNGGPGLQIIGFANSLLFNNCEFDGVFNTTNTGENIFIGQGTGSVFPPYDIRFNLLTSQFSNVGVIINGADAVEFAGAHFEALQQVIQLGTGAGFGSLGITMHDDIFANGSGVGLISPGVGVGSGYIVKNLGSTANVSMQIIDSHAYNTPDAFLAGNSGSIATFGDTIGPEGAYTYQNNQFESALVLPGQAAPSGIGANTVIWSDLTTQVLKANSNNTGAHFLAPMERGSCTMATATTCTTTGITNFSSTPLCFVNATTAPATAVSGSCAIAGTTVTVTAGASNSLTWNWLLVGNPD